MKFFPLVDYLIDNYYIRKPLHSYCLIHQDYHNWSDLLVVWFFKLILLTVLGQVFSNPISHCI